MIRSTSLNVDEVASLLGLSRNTVYKMAKEGTLPSYRVGRKLRFSMTDIESGIMRTATTSNASAANEGDLESLANDLARSDVHRLSVGGHEALAGTVAHHLSQLGAPAVTKPMSCYAALVNLYIGNVDLALVNLYDVRTNSFNTPYVRQLCPGVSLRIVRLLKRRVGFIVQTGNPKNITTWGALLHDDVRIAAREKGTSAQVLLDQKLIGLEADLPSVRERSTTCKTPIEAVARVAAGASDVCVGCKEESLALSGVQFIPMMTECVDLVVRKAALTRETARAVRELTSDGKFKIELERVMDCDASQCGVISYEC